MNRGQLILVPRSVVALLTDSHRARRRALAGSVTQGQGRWDGFIAREVLATRGLVRHIVKTVPFGEAYLRKLVIEYTEHCHLERKHLGLDNQPIDRGRIGPEGEVDVSWRRRLGGTLNYYCGEAA